MKIIWLGSFQKGFHLEEQSVFSDFEEYCVQEKRGHKFAGGERLGEEDLRELCNDLGKGTERAVIPLTQFHGQLVRVPPGYVHLSLGSVSSGELPPLHKHVAKE